MNRNERIESTKCFEMHCRKDGERWLVHVYAIFGYSPKRRVPDKHTCALRLEAERFDSWGGQDPNLPKHLRLHPAERYCPQIGARVEIIRGLHVDDRITLEVVELPSDDSPFVRLRRV